MNLNAATLEAAIAPDLDRWSLAVEQRTRIVAVEIDEPRVIDTDLLLFDGDEDRTVATCRLVVIDLDAGDTPGSVFRLCDERSADWSAAAERWMAGDGSLDEAVQFVIVDRVWVAPEHRGHGAGELVAAYALSVHGSGLDPCAVIVGMAGSRDHDPGVRDQVTRSAGRILEGLGLERRDTDAGPIHVSDQGEHVRAVGVLTGPHPLR